MSETKFTPGTWRFLPLEQWPFGVSVVADDKVILRQDAAAHSTQQKTRTDCEQGVGFDRKDISAVQDAIREQDANARLIAAAKDLLGACEAALEYDAAIQRHVAKGQSWVEGDDLDVLYDKWITASRAAVGKVKEGK